MTKYFTLILSAAFLFILFALPSCLKDTSIDTTIPPEPPPFEMKMIWKEVAQKTGASHWNKISDGDTLRFLLSHIRNSKDNTFKGMQSVYQYPSKNLGVDLDSIGGVFITGLDFHSHGIFTSTDSSQVSFFNYNEEKSEAQDTLVRDTVGVFQYTAIDDTLFLKDTLQTPQLEMKFIKIE